MKTIFVKYRGEAIELVPVIGLYRVRDYMGTPAVNIAITLQLTDGSPFAHLTTSFGEFIGMKNCAYIDTNNFPDAVEILAQGYAKDTGFRKYSGYCTYPLWQFSEDFLKCCEGAGNYRKYLECYKILVEDKLG